MRRPLVYILLLMTVSACSLFESYSSKLSRAARAIDSSPDSALQILDEIPYSQLGSEADRALYGLLATEARFKLYKPVLSDSLIDRSISYYRQNGDEFRLAVACYYRGAVLCETGRKEEGIVCLREAENIAHTLGDELLRNKIYETLSLENSNSGNHALALHYSKLFLRSSVLLNDTGLMSRAYDDLSLDYFRLGNTDSAFFFRNKNLQLVSAGSNEDKAYAYANYADDLMSLGQYQEAERWLHKALLLKPKANIYIMLGEIHELAGDTLRAQEEWQKAISFGQPRFTMKACKHLARQAFLHNDIPAGLRYTEQADSLAEDYQRRQHTVELAEIQHKYNTTLVRQQMYKYVIWALAAALVALILLLFLILFLRKTYRYQHIINENVRKMLAMEQRIDNLRASGKDSEKEIRLLQQKIEKLSRDMRERLSRGREIYEQLKAKKELPRISKRDDEYLINYCAVINDVDFKILCQQYPSFTPRPMVCALLSRMGYADKDILYMLSVSQSAIRVYRNRLKNSK